VKVALYARYSSDNQRQESIEAQIRAINHYAEHKGLSIVKHYIDEAKSATTDDRPAFQQMISEAESGIFSAIIVHKLDRFARDRYDSIFYKKKLKNNNVNLISVTENIDGTPESVILESMLEGMAEYYSRNLSREAMKGLMQNAYKCLNTGGKPPFGYDVDPVTKAYTINQHEAIAVREIFSQYLNDKSYKDIVDWLNNNGFRTKKGNLFGKNSLHSLLKNEKYIGTYIFNKSTRSKYERSNSDIIKIENGVPSIIKKDDFMKVQERLKQNQKNSQAFKAVSIYILSGKVECGKCGGKMFGNRRKAGRYGTIWSGYQCSNRKKYKTCDAKEIKKDTVEEMVLNHLQNKIFSDEFIDFITQEIHSQWEKSLDNSGNEINLLEQKLKKIQAQIDNIVKAIMDGLYNPAMKIKMDELENTKNEIISMIATERSKSKKGFSFEEIKKYLSIGKGISEKSASEQKRIIDTFIEKVIIHPDKIDIYFYLDKLKEQRGYDGAP